MRWPGRTPAGDVLGAGYGGAAGDGNGGGTGLALRGVRAGYGDEEVLHGVDLVVRPGELLVVLGLNGAGKTTLLRTVIGELAPTGGEVAFGGEPVTGEPVRARVRRGMALVPEGRRLFPDLTVRENVELGAWGGGVPRREIRGRFAEICDRFDLVARRQHQRAGTLSGGQQQLVAVARALVLRPRLLLVDECSLGLAPVTVAEVFAMLAELAAGGTAVLAVEQTPSILRHAARAVVLVQGALADLDGGASIAEQVGELRRLYLG